MNAALEYNDRGCMLFSLDRPGAFARGKTPEEAAARLPEGVTAYCRWAGVDVPDGPVTITEKKYQPELHVEDADGDIIFAGERAPMSRAEYEGAKALVLRSAADLDRLYAAVPDKDRPLGPARATFYGEYPDTARKMFDHTNYCTAYYVGQLGAEPEELPGCLENRRLALAAVEALPGLSHRAAPVDGCGEEWSLRKVMRRFCGHDRLHARAMYRRARAVWGDAIPDVFCVGH